ncbi:MAG: 2Fe-2S iron-sulfur cluster-binding protein, partial [Sedimenticolaceae bacterium]
MSETKLKLEILRYDPEKDQEPHFQTYPVTCQDDWMVLDAINYVKDHVDPTISYRWSCHMAVCGSCGMMIDGEPKLA